MDEVLGHSSVLAVSPGGGLVVQLHEGEIGGGYRIRCDALDAEFEVVGGGTISTAAYMNGARVISIRSLGAVPVSAVEVGMNLRHVRGPTLERVAAPADWTVQKIDRERVVIKLSRNPATSRTRLAEEPADGDQIVQTRTGLKIEVSRVEIPADIADYADGLRILVLPDVRGLLVGDHLRRISRWQVRLDDV